MIFENLFRLSATQWSRLRLRHSQLLAPTAVLAGLLRAARDTRYGRRYGFAEILAANDVYAAYRERVPVIDYQAWVEFLGELSALDGVAKPLIDIAWPGRVDIFCLSSGTTSGRTKFVPYSRDMAQVNRSAALDMLAWMVERAPDVAPPLGRPFYMSGSTNLETTANGCLCGDMSAITKYLSPRLLERVTLPPRHISNLEPWEKRLTALVELLLQNPRITSLYGIPIWQLTLLEAVAARTGRSPREALPNLRFIVHGGMSIQPYRARIRELVGPDVGFLEIYAASETGITAFSLPGEQGMRFWQNYQVFYEFEDADGQIHTSETVEAGKAYGLLVSSCSGLWRYRIGDLVVFRSTKPLILDYVTRDKTTSAFDEKVTEKELEHAMAAMPDAVADFSLGPDIQGRRHVWFLMSEKQPTADWVARLDQVLRGKNQDYDDYRGDGRISAPIAIAIADRGAYLKLLGRAEGGQRKFPRLLAPAEVAKCLEQYRQPLR